MGEIKLIEIAYGDYGRGIKLTNGTIDLIVTLDVGPRIISFGFTGGKNEFYEEFSGNFNNNQWKVIGGHRLWHSPEDARRTYIPDNQPLNWGQIKNGVTISQQTEDWTQIKKDLHITLDPEKNTVEIIHKLTNKNAWPVKLSAWGISVMSPGGKQIIPQPVKDTGLLPNRLISLWPYTKMNDPRVTWGDKYIILLQNPDIKQPFKIGLPNEDGWAAYFNHNNLFIKRYNHQPAASYPDFGASYESYTNNLVMEMETLSPLTLLAFEETISHTEKWELYPGVEPPSNKEKEIKLTMEKYL